MIVFWTCRTCNEFLGYDGVIAFRHRDKNGANHHVVAEAEREREPTGIEREQAELDRRPFANWN